MGDAKTVLHVGPVNTKGGMASVIRILSENPPDGWRAETLATHVEGSNISKFLYWRRARRELLRMIKVHPPDIIHIHTASDYSWWRKRRVALLAHRAGIPVILHFHSGKFDSFCRSKAGKDVERICSLEGVYPVVLSEVWKDRLAEWLPEAIVIHNPVDPNIVMSGVESKPKQVLFMGRDDPVKRADIAIEAVRMAREDDSELQLMMTGIEANHPLTRPYAGEDWLHPLGWVSEEKKRLLLNESAILLVTSEYECQPMVVLEAQSCGLPVLASQEVAEVVDGVYVIETNSSSDWAEKLHLHIENSDSIEVVLAPSRQWDTFYQSLIP